MPFRSKAAALVTYLGDWIGAHPGAAAGAILGSVVALDDIARTNGSPPPAVDVPVLLDTLQTPNGGFGATPGALTPDPHTTYDAVRLGARADSSTLGYFIAHARTDGWPIDQTQVDPCSTYMGAVVDKAEADRTHDPQLHATAVELVSGLSTHPEATEVALCTLALANIVGTQPPQGLINEMRIAAVAALSSSPTEDRLSALRILQILGTGRGASPLPTPFARQSPLLGTGAYEECVASRRLVGLAATCELANALRMPDGTYKQAPTAPGGDLQSTAVALQDSSNIAARMAAFGRFRQDGSTWMLATGSTTNVSNLHSVFLGLILADVVRDPDYL